MATCALTFFAVAVTVGCVLQSSVPHTLKGRVSPTGGAAARAGATALGRSQCPNWAASWRSARRRFRSNCSCTGTDVAPAAPATSGGAAASPAPRNWNDAESSGTPLAPCGTSRYSMVDAVVLAGNTAHPAVCAGSIAVYSVACSAMRPPLAAVQGARGGCVAFELLQAAASSDDSPTSQIPRSLDIGSAPREFAGARERQSEADRSHDLVHTNHRYDQGLEGDPPFGKGAAGNLRQRQG